MNRKVSGIHFVSKIGFIRAAAETQKLVSQGNEMTDNSLMIERILREGRRIETSDADRSTFSVLHKGKIYTISHSFGGIYGIEIDVYEGFGKKGVPKYYEIDVSRGLAKYLNALIQLRRSFTPGPNAASALCHSFYN